MTKLVECQPGIRNFLYLNGFVKDDGLAFSFDDSFVYENVKEVRHINDKEGRHLYVNREKNIIISIKNLIIVEILRIKIGNFTIVTNGDYEIEVIDNKNNINITFLFENIFDKFKNKSNITNIFIKDSNGEKVNGSRSFRIITYKGRIVDKDENTSITSNGGIFRHEYIMGDAENMLNYLNCFDSLATTNENYILMVRDSVNQIIRRFHISQTEKKEYFQMFEKFALTYLSFKQKEVIDSYIPPKPIKSNKK